MDLNRLRPYIAITMMVIIAGLAFTGLLLYFSPHGPDSKFWECMGLSKHQYKDIHFGLGLLVVSLAIAHGFLNFKSLSNYLKKPTEILSYPLAWALFLVFFFVAVVIHL